MNTETKNDGLKASKVRISNAPKARAQICVSALALLSLLVAAILNPHLWIQFGIALVLVGLSLWFAARVERAVRNPWESQETQTLIEAAERQVSKKDRIVNRISRYWPAFVLVAAVFSVVLSTSAEFDLSASLSLFSAVLLVTYVQALALTVPVSISSVLRTATGSGILIRNRRAFENANKLNLVLFTKSGVLTELPKVVNSIHLAANSTITDEHKLLALAASVESMSSHVMAQAIIKSADNAKLKITTAKDFIEHLGFGVEGNVSGHQVLVGSTSLLIQRDIRMEIQELIYADESTKSGYSIVCVEVNGVLEGLFRFTDAIRPSSAKAVYLIAKERIRVGMATGDSAGTAQHKAGQLAIAEVYAELSPPRKISLLASQQAKGVKVGVISDPFTESELLRQADLSIALEHDLEMSAFQADIQVRSADPELAAQIIALSSRLRKRTNLGLGFGLATVFCL